VAQVRQVRPLSVLEGRWHRRCPGWRGRCPVSRSQRRAGLRGDV